MEDYISQVRAEGILIGIVFVVAVLVIRSISKKRREERDKLEQLYEELLYKNVPMQLEFEQFRKQRSSKSKYQCLLEFFHSQERVDRALLFKNRNRDLLCHMKDLEKSLCMRVNWNKTT